MPRNHERVADAAQDVFLQLFKSNGALKSVDPNRAGGFRAYLYGVTTKVACEQDRLAARQRRTSGEAGLDLDQFGDSQASQSEVFDQAWAKLVVEEAYEVMSAENGVEPLATRRMRVLQLRYGEGLPPREISQRLAIEDVREVYQMLDTGKDQFRRALFAVMVSYHPSSSRGGVEALCRELLDLF